MTNSKKVSQIIIGRNGDFPNSGKMIYSMVKQNSKSNVVITGPFQIHNLKSSPGIYVTEESLFYVDKLNKAVDGVCKVSQDKFIMNSDGTLIKTSDILLGIDIVTKVHDFTVDGSGLIQYEIIHHPDQELPEYNITNVWSKTNDVTWCQCHKKIKNKFQSYKLKVFYLLMKIGGLVSISDKAEKILHIPLIDPSTGYIGEFDYPKEQYNEFQSRFYDITQVWPELELSIQENNKVYSPWFKEIAIKNPKSLIKNCLLILHRNFGQIDIEIITSYKWINPER